MPFGTDLFFKLGTRIFSLERNSAQGARVIKKKEKQCGKYVNE
jgi:hypothetical protein